MRKNGRRDGKSRPRGKEAFTTDFATWIEGRGGAAATIVTIAIVLLFGFAFGRLAKLAKLPAVTGYVLGGIAIGPYCLNLVPESFIVGSEFLPDVALAFIAFGAGEFFKIDSLRRYRFKTVTITLFESLAASVVVFVALYFALGVDLGFSLVLAALASATAPASTLMTVRQTKARGELVDVLLQVVAYDDGVSLVAYSVAIAFAGALASSSATAADVVFPLVYSVGAVALGFGCGFLLKILVNHRSTDNRLIVAVAVLFTFCGACAAVGTSPLLGCMAMGATYINATGDERLFGQLNYFSPPVLLLFFVRSGANFNLSALTRSSAAFAVPLALVSAVYFVSRIVGKAAGAYAGCAIVKTERSTRSYLGLALIPQAGVAIGLAAIGSRTLGGELGEALNAVVLASSVLYELVGPPCAKLALVKSGSVPPKDPPTAATDQPT